LTNSPEPLLGIREVAGLFGVDISTIRRWEQAGYLRSVRIGRRGHRRFHAEDIQGLLESRAEGQEKAQAQEAGANGTS
jgi:excisionase family DNA binding protein